MSGETIFQNDNNAPAVLAYAVTKSDTDDLTYTSRALYVGGAGDVCVDMYGPFSGYVGDRALNPITVTFKNVVAGTILPIAVRRVRSTGTTATNIVTMS